MWILGETSLSMLLGCTFQLMTPAGICHLLIVEEGYKISNDCLFKRSDLRNCLKNSIA